MVGNISKTRKIQGYSVRVKRDQVFIEGLTIEAYKFHSRVVTESSVLPAFIISIYDGIRNHIIDTLGFVPLERLSSRDFVIDHQDKRLIDGVEYYRVQSFDMINTPDARVYATGNMLDISLTEGTLRFDGDVFIDGNTDINIVSSKVRFEDTTLHGKIEVENSIVTLIDSTFGSSWVSDQKNTISGSKVIGVDSTIINSSIEQGDLSMVDTFIVNTKFKSPPFGVSFSGLTTNDEVIGYSGTGIITSRYGKYMYSGHSSDRLHKAPFYVQFFMRRVLDCKFSGLAVYILNSYFGEFGLIERDEKWD